MVSGGQPPPSSRHPLQGFPKAHARPVDALSALKPLAVSAIPHDCFRATVNALLATVWYGVYTDRQAESLCAMFTSAGLDPKVDHATFRQTVSFVLGPWKPKE